MAAGRKKARIEKEADDHIPEGVAVEILKTLPVKSLLRFSCVCKTWYSVISDPQFSRSLHRMRPSLLISEHGKISSIPIQSLLAREDKVLTSHSPLPWENSCEGSSINTILGSSNGLVCLEHKFKYFRGRRRRRRVERFDLILWNPSTRKFKLLPYPGGIPYSISFRHGSCTYVWFGFDELIDDYKLVLLNCSGFLSPPVIPDLNVFTLKSNTWRSPSIDHIALGHIREFCFIRSSKICDSFGALCNGAIHWAKTNVWGQDAVLALDLATEKFRRVKFAPRFEELFPWVGSLVGGCLCLCSLKVEDGFHVANLWIMKEYGVESSWTKVVSLLMSDVPTSRWKVRRFYPILLSNEGEEIVVMYHNWREKEAKIVKRRVEGAKKVRLEETLLCLHRFGSDAILHMEESLVPVD